MPASPCLQYTCHQVHCPLEGKQTAGTLLAQCEQFAEAQHAGWEEGTW